jgi:hypothetical protein
LNNKIGNGDLSIENQKKVFYDYAVSRKLGLNLNNASCSPMNREPSLPGVSKAHEKIIEDDMEMLNSYVISYGSGSEALSIIQSYKKRLNQVNYKGFVKAEFDVLNAHVSALEFLTGTFVGKTFFENISTFTNRQLSRGASQFRTSSSPSASECAFYFAMYSYYTYACITTPWPANVISCGLLAYYGYKTFQCPGGGGGSIGNPCTDPCCGVSCISGYVCNGGQCVPDGNYVPPGCPEGSFWNGSECVYQ